MKGTSISAIEGKQRRKSRTFWVSSFLVLIIDNDFWLYCLYYCADSLGEKRIDELRVCRECWKKMSVLELSFIWRSHRPTLFSLMLLQAVDSSSFLFLRLYLVPVCPPARRPCAFYRVLWRRACARDVTMVMIPQHRLVDGFFLSSFLITNRRSRANSAGRWKGRGKDKRWNRRRGWKTRSTVSI